MKWLSNTNSRRLAVVQVWATVMTTLAGFSSLAVVLLLGRAALQVWVVTLVITVGVGAVNVGVATKLRARRPDTVSRYVADFEFPFLVREGSITAFVDKLNQVASDELRGFRCQWIWGAMMLHCELPDGVSASDAKKFVKANRPMAARPMHLRPLV